MRSPKLSEHLLTLLDLRCINFANTTPDELEQLNQACQVFDQAYCKAGKMDPDVFSSLDPSRTEIIKIIRDYLLEGEESKRNMEIEACKLNIYSAHVIFVCSYPMPYCIGEGSFFEMRLDTPVTPPSKKMFGSLVVVFPTRYEGGALILRHRGREWIFDPGQALACGTLDPSIGYVAILNDIEQDVAPITTGHCVTLTYNLYFDDDGRLVSGKDAIWKHLKLLSPKPPNQDGFREAFDALLENPEFMAEGGTLAFGLRHGYPIGHDRGLRYVHNFLKGSDAVVYKSTRALGFEPMLCMHYDESCDAHEGMVSDELVNFCGAFFDYEQDDSIREYIQAEGAIPVRQDGGEIHFHDPYTSHSYDDDYLKNPEPVEWVTPITTYNHIEGIYVDKVKLRIDGVYGDACMIVRIGEVGDRLAYPRNAQIKNKYAQNYRNYGRDYSL
jgi:hypothetical protein